MNCEVTVSLRDYELTLQIGKNANCQNYVFFVYKDAWNTVELANN
jgi:hypothetical protein